MMTLKYGPQKKNIELFKKIKESELIFSLGKGKDNTFFLNLWYILTFSQFKDDNIRSSNFK